MTKAVINAVSKRLTKVCTSFPEAEVEPSGDHLAFRVRKKVFAYFLNNHHGDGIVCVTAKVAPGDNQALATAQPERFCLPAYIASRGWVSLRLDAAEIDWEEVRELVSDSYRRVAPKRLADTIPIPE